MMTIYDVAERARVSPATVSRVLNNKENVKPETRAKIKKVCQELNYVPNSNAGSLKKKTTGTLALIIPDIPNPFFVSVLQGFEELAIKRGYNTILCNTGQSVTKEQDYIQMILEKRIDGVAISTVSKNSQHIEKIIERDVPFILIDRKIEDFDVDVVCGDSYQGAIKLVEHLIELGHEKISMIAAPLHLSSSRERVEGYKEALKRNNIPFNSDLLQIESPQNGGYSRTRAYEMTGELIECGKNFTAIFVANNLMALGAYKALLENGLEVPEDVALVCFDDLSLDFEINPFFTVMKQPASTMGNVAAKILIDKIDGQSEKNKRQVVFQPELIIRKSSGDKINVEQATGK